MPPEVPPEPTVTHCEAFTVPFTWLTVPVPGVPVLAVMPATMMRWAVT